MARNDAQPRIALLGFNLESNRFSPVVARKDFEEDLYLVGEAILADAATDAPRGLATLTGFIQTMDQTGPWTPVPIVLVSGGAAGCVDHAFYLEVRDEVQRLLEAELPVDGVYFSEHGAAVSTEITDPDGDLFAMVRGLVGPDVPIVSTLDLHANISDTMVDSTDLLISYLTNPHVDQHERGVEAGHAMRELLAGVKTEKAFIRLPLVAPNVTQLTASGPYGDAIDLGQTKLDDTIMNVSIVSGFMQGDTPENGMAFIVTARGDRDAARRVCRDLAERTWNDRHRFVPKLTSLDECVAMALDVGSDPSKESVLIADVADNPGSGARGNTTWLLKAMHDAGARDVILGPFFDPPLSAEARERGPGASFRARFNRAEESEFSEPWEADAEVVSLWDGTFVGRAGATAAGRTVDLGPTAVLRVGTVTVVVTSLRKQALDTGHFENFGVSVVDARTVIVKSRGHFRAGFAHIFPPARIFEADLPGLSTPNMKNYPFERLPRPVFPLDPDATWEPPAL